jgi:O-succinylbenzoate synthase
MPAPHTPGLDEVLATLRVVQIPMRVRFRGVMVREAALLEGPAGWGEFAPFPEYDDTESSRWLAAALEAAWLGWPVPQRSCVPVNATVPAVAPHEVASVLARYDGCTTAKVKVAERGHGLADDVSRVAAVRDVMGPSGRIRVDANGGWDVAQAAQALSRLAAYGLEYAEQPCASVDELVELRTSLARNGIDVLVAADESIRKASDPLRVAREGAADVVVVKVAPLGGVRAALHIAAECGLPAVVSSALDTSVGIAAGVALAASLPDLPFACGLSTVELMAGDVASPSLVPHRGEIPVGPAAVDEALLERWAAPRDRHDWWLERVRRCWEVLGADDRG